MTNSDSNKNSQSSSNIKREQEQEQEHQHNDDTESDSGSDIEMLSNFNHNHNHNRNRSINRNNDTSIVSHCESNSNSNRNQQRQCPRLENMENINLSSIPARNRSRSNNHNHNSRKRKRSICHEREPIVSNESMDESIVSDVSLTLSLDLDILGPGATSSRSVRTSQAEPSRAQNWEMNNNLVSSSSPEPGSVQRRHEQQVQIQSKLAPILQDRQLTKFILQYLDDSSIHDYILINTKCNEISKHLQPYIDISDKQWLYKYVLADEHIVYHMHDHQEIILDFNGNDQVWDNYIYYDFMMETIHKMSMHGLFRSCHKLSIISPTTKISRALSEALRSLDCVNEIYFKDIEIFPMIKIITNIPDGHLRRLSMINVSLKRNPDNDEHTEYTSTDSWMFRNLSDGIMNEFIERILECEYIAINGWRNDYDYWYQSYLKWYSIFDTKRENKLSLKFKLGLKNSPIKEIEYIPINPLSDRIPHRIVSFLLRFKSPQIEKLTINITELYHAIVPDKKSRKIKLESLKVLKFGYDDKISYKFLDFVKVSNSLENVIIYTPNGRELMKAEQNMIKAIQKKCRNNIVIEKETNLLSL